MLLGVPASASIAREEQDIRTLTIEELMRIKNIGEFIANSIILCIQNKA